MQLITFPNYHKYIRSQQHADWRKSERVGFVPDEIHEIVRWKEEWSFPEIQAVLCHGARNGQELDEFAKFCQEVKVIGTDLFPREHLDVLQWDFHEQKDEWIGHFDIVYSNSFDHTYDPHKLLSAWFAQLNNSGILAIQWNDNNVWARGGDCFGAGLHEYMDLMDQHGRILDLIYLGGRAKTTIVIADKSGGWKHG